MGGCFQVGSLPTPASAPHKRYDVLREPIHPWNLRTAARLLRLGAIVAYPTEAVFGLGCNPYDEAAVFRLLALKQRPVEKGMILIADNFERLKPFVGNLPQETLDHVLSHWPGPVTWLLPAAENTPYWLTGRHTTLAMRVTNHPIAAALCRAAAMPLVSTSANLSRRQPARTPLQVRLRCGDGVDWIIHGKTGGLSKPTPIRDALSGKILRG
ncbi:MAG: Sua5/YciO/YrdC/YwlC family protein [Candidatus Thiodiazotropha sp. (ex Semelilucina semeliformis)]|nr:Sua5/YciO/YrdC/YwlC family protein [Candidatus Thiodiazotropha sp. (ex Semelilucina semeliformis)]